MPEDSGREVDIETGQDLVFDFNFWFLMMILIFGCLLIFNFWFLILMVNFSMGHNDMVECGAHMGQSCIKDKALYLDGECY